jgi:hypothetical protein
MYPTARSAGSLSSAANVLACISAGPNTNSSTTSANVEPVTSSQTSPARMKLALT